MQYRYIRLARGKNPKRMQDLPGSLDLTALGHIEFATDKSAREPDRRVLIERGNIAVPGETFFAK